MNGTRKLQLYLVYIIPTIHRNLRYRPLVTTMSKTSGKPGWKVDVW
jgi:hypothetical protein